MNQNKKFSPVSIITTIHPEITFQSPIKNPYNSIMHDRLNNPICDREEKKKYLICGLIL